MWRVMRVAAELRVLLADARFRRLFAVRITSQCADGIFQVALTSYVLFDPQRQPDARAIAAALAAVLLPFSLIGPFTGVFLDRWSRRQILLMCNLMRLLPLAGVAGAIAASRSDWVLFSLVVTAFSINRFFLAGLSAALPHVVDPAELVLANSLTPTSGTLAFMAGLGLGTGARSFVPFGDPDVVIVALAGVTYLAAAALTTRVPVHELGPDLTSGAPPVGIALRSVIRSLLAGLAHLRQRPTATHALAAIAAHRFCYGLSTVATILLYRSYFHRPSDTDAALTGLSVAVLVSGVGFLVAAITTPVATARTTPQWWIVLLLALAALSETFPGGLYTQPGLLIAAFFLGIASQGIKICVDTLVQTSVEDEFRGRVFAWYDVGFNVVFVAAAVIGAVIIPDTGKSYAVLALVAVGYAATAAWYWRAERLRTADLALAG
jgi:MFS family permease